MKNPYGVLILGISGKTEMRLLYLKKVDNVSG